MRSADARCVRSDAFGVSAIFAVRLRRRTSTLIRSMARALSVRSGRARPTARARRWRWTSSGADPHPSSGPRARGSTKKEGARRRARAAGSRRPRAIGRRRRPGVRRRRPPGRGVPARPWPRIRRSRGLTRADVVAHLLVEEAEVVVVHERAARRRALDGGRRVLDLLREVRLM